MEVDRKRKHSSPQTPKNKKRKIPSPLQGPPFAVQPLAPKQCNMPCCSPKRSSKRAMDPISPSKMFPDRLKSHSQAAAAEEKTDSIKFEVIANRNRTPDTLVKLINLKVVFGQQLPKMPRDYISRLIMDSRHESLCLTKVVEVGGKRYRKVIGGICIRPFRSQRFAEIVFCAVTSTEQVRGFGTRLMNELKEHVKTQGIEYFLTYADNYATGYFRKQGFSKHITMPDAQWKDYIKEYDGGTLMECKINPKVNYRDVKGMVRDQRDCVADKIKNLSNSHVVHPGLEAFKLGLREVPIEKIPGVLDSGWVPSKVKRVSSRLNSVITRPSPLTDLTAKLGLILKAINKMGESWPFEEPVDPKAVPEYYKLIKHPMDLSTMAGKLDQQAYTSVASFERDMLLVVNNCLEFNEPDSTYCRCANALEAEYYRLLKEFDLDDPKRKLLVHSDIPGDPPPWKPAKSSRRRSQK